tara:strand:+ start:1288 stop:2685 length:1398 start_codon:yes stop_codon:yes gene_type:complete
MFKNIKIHFVGIGGIGMSAIADVLHQKGFKISGSDLSNNRIIESLKKKGVKINLGHTPKNLVQVDLVVYSSAIKKDNIELKLAKKNKIPTFSRAMMLAEVMRLKQSITVSGSHGKTTTTSLIASILEASNLDPTILNGGIINSLKGNAKLGKGDWIVAEADESDGSFIFLPSTIGVINNIDLEHLDFYKNIKHLKDSFVKYSEKIPFYGFLALCMDDKNVKSIRKILSTRKIISYGLSGDFNFRATNIKTIIKNNLFLTKFDVIENFDSKKIIKNFLAPLIGNHNIQNILAAICVARGLSIPYSKIKKALKNFQGVNRRFTILHRDADNIIIDDYAHHPVEIKATLDSLRLITKKRIISIFEPHRYSRLSAMFDDFLKSFRESDFIYILPVYSAGEKNNFMISSEIFFNELKNKFKEKKVFLVKDENKFFKNLKNSISKGDRIIFLGAGSSSLKAKKFKDFFQNK